MPVQQEIKRLTAPGIRARKGGEPIVCLTSYAMEHRLYPLALKLVASGAAWLDKDRVVFASAELSPSLRPDG